MTRPVRVANISGFYGDRLSAAKEMLDGPDPIDILTGDYLAELTMFILWKARRNDATAGYASSFLHQMEQILGPCLGRGIKVVSNAGGLNPHGLASKLHELAESLGLAPNIAVVSGDDLIAELPHLQALGHQLRHLDTRQPLADAHVTPLTANAYLGAFGIAAGLASGADIVVTSRVTDAALVLGPAAWWHSWSRTAYDELAGAVVAGHVIECGPQATGGNYAFASTQLTDYRYPGFPIAEVASDGSSVITKQPGTGGMVTIGTVTAQLLYEIDEPSYQNPDVITRFDSVRLEQIAPDRVAISETKGLPPSGQLKVAINYSGGWRNTMSVVLTGLDREDKAARTKAMLGDLLGGWSAFASHDLRLVGDELRITVKDTDREKVGRRFSNAIMELLLASYAGAYATTPPSDSAEYGVYWPTLVPASVVRHTVTTNDGSAMVITPVSAAPAQVHWVGGASAETDEPRVSNEEELRRIPLGLIYGGRSGDKGGNANVGLWASSDGGYRWLATCLTVELFKRLLPETAGLPVRRYELPNLRAVNFVVIGLLGEGVASSVRPDPQAKSLAEQLRAQQVEIPVAVLAASPVGELA